MIKKQDNDGYSLEEIEQEVESMIKDGYSKSAEKGFTRRLSEIFYSSITKKSRWA